ncbi:MAG: glycerophosphodiester phosphodiesterase family protein [Candidatus Thermoplasmatota archaeon]|nr:glycerophosphodiester phosphodiesterase family protein [Candidatus Thermoplasmatota archaeon]
MTGGGKWRQPEENSIEALVHGITFSDGVEFDLRMDSDGELVIFHDEFVPGDGRMANRCIENMSTSELRSRGVVVFEDLLSEPKFVESWSEVGKTVDIEIKIPHPVTNIGTDHYLSSIMEKLEETIGPLGLPQRTTIVSSFSPRIAPVAKSSEFGFPVTRLMPRIRSWGRYWRLKRVVAMPHFASTSVPSMVNSFRDEGMESIGMALDYLVGWTRFVSPGSVVGIRGKGLEKLHRSLKGMGAFVWPAPLGMEDELIEAGVSLVSDHLDPDVLVKPNGSIRWPRPASQPLDEEWKGIFGSASVEEYGDLFREASDSLPSWSELGAKLRTDIVVKRGRSSYWEGSEEKWSKEAERGLPWGCPRIIGHRGAGKTHGV